MGRVVDLINPKTDEIIPSLISRDRLTNELVAYKVENIKIPNEIKGIRLNEHQKQTLLEGGPLYLEGMISSKGGFFSAYVQFNADKKYVEFMFDHTERQQQSQSKAEQAIYLDVNSQGKTTEAVKNMNKPLSTGHQSTKNKTQQIKQNKPQPKTRRQSI
ncbi:hypothetical protein JOE44_002171 [Chryseobacterium sp. PvR013]|uniref:DUF3945 domain-containing protein n=1 Tax=Chryseobacterium sp. PvR013 TaxID=2806595 RepID=UPI001B4E1001|nr:hypothetical protein [Chryseobacterium sp. PvR013]